MTKNNKIAAAVIGSLALIIGLGAYELNRNASQGTSAIPTKTTVETTQVQPTPALSPTAAPVYRAAAVPAPGQLAPPAPANVVQPVGPSDLQMRGGRTITQSGVMQAPPTYGSSPYVRSQVTTLQAQQPLMAPVTVVQPRPTTTLYSERTTAYVPETAPPIHRVYVHRRIRYRSSGKIHVARAVKHTIAFAVKMPGRLRL